MPKPANYAAMAQYLQSGSSTRSIEFRDGGFYCEGDEVTGRKYIVNFQNLHFGRVTRMKTGLPSYERINRSGIISGP
jgi:hypothetical protein